MLKLENITGGYNANRDILAGLSLHVRRGESVGVIGLNGSGKSTLGKAIMNRLPCRGGRVFLDGADVSQLPTTCLVHRGIACLLQGAPLFDQLTVAENLQLASNNDMCRFLEFQQRHANSFQQFFPPSKSFKRESVCAAKQNLYHRRTNKLSGGQRHLLALACALLQQPKLLLLDEPSAGLDPAAEATLYETLAKVRMVTGMAILLIEQNVTFAQMFCQRLFVMRQGCLQKTNLPVS